MSAAAGQPSDRLTFWRNWYDASRQLPDDMRLAWLDAVLDYAFGGVEQDFVDHVGACLGLVLEFESFRAVDGERLQAGD